ncbi:MAG TPA: Na+/H+ antiporter [Thermoplasmata archaeon]|nr:Na+/H+ antiporter [Thermoplasmata archaeon]
MVDIQPFVLVLVVAAIVAVATKYVRLPYTIALVLAGLAIGFTGLGSLGTLPTLTEDLVFYIFIPGLIFEAAIALDIRHLRENLWEIIALAFPGVVVSTLLVGLLVHYLVGMDLAAALLLGAMLSPTDPVSVVALFKEIGAPVRLRTVVEGEALFNDGTGVVTFLVVLLLLRTGQLQIDVAALEFGKEILGGLLVGGIAGYATFQLLKPIDDRFVETMFTIILAFGAFVVSGLLGVSGVIAVVVSGLIIGNYAASRAMSPTSRLAMMSFWEFMAFLLNSVLFVLIGFEVHEILVSELTPASLVPALAAIGLAVVAVLIARAAVVYGVTSLISRFRASTPRPWRHVLFWGGLHGSIPIALALALPRVGEPGAPAIFAQIVPGMGLTVRDAIVVLTFGVVLVSLTVRGLTIRPLMRRLGFFEIPQKRLEYERLTGELVSLEVASAELDAMHRSREVGTEVYLAAKKDYDERMAALNQQMESLVAGHGFLRDEQRSRVLRSGLMAQRSAIQSLRASGRLTDAAAENLLVDLDKRLVALDASPPKNGSKNDAT